MPSLTLTGKYKLKAKLPLNLVIEISGNGELINHVKNSLTKMRLFALKFEKDGNTFVKFNKANVKFILGQSKVTLTNLFNGDPTLSRIGNQLINENQELFLGEIIPVLEKQFSESFVEVANKIIGNATFDKIFPNT